VVGLNRLHGFVIFSILIGAIGVTLIAEYRLSGTGRVAAVGLQVYSGVDCSNLITSVDWGIIYPGGSINRVVYVKNTGNVAVVLSLVVQSWVPITAPQYISVTWDAEGKVLDAGKTMIVSLICSISTEITGINSFSNVVVMKGASK
jgi:hypothetical protein